MKVKTIISACLTLFIASVVVSCESMLSVDSDSVIYEKDNKLNSTVDTVYSFLGIIQRMQAIADRTVVLGEIRGDLVSLTGRESDDLRDLYKYDFTQLKTSNKYIDPIDYYAVINNCNYYLNTVDTAFVRNQENVFLGEYISVLSMRAWTYLQLAQVYGRVYFSRDPIMSGSDAEGSEQYRLMDIRDLSKELIKDFEERFLDEKLPSFTVGGNKNDDGTSSMSHKAQNFIIPLRLIMGDLYLWAEDYAKAAHYYHEYLYYKQNYVATGAAIILWDGSTFEKLGDDSYAATFASNVTPIAYIPMEAEKYAGITSELPNIFNSTEDNYYWPQLSYSKAMLNLSARQQYCYHRINANSGVSMPVYMDRNVQDNALLKGDLRLQSIFQVKSSKEGDNKSTIYNSTRQTLQKINAERVPIYRTDVVYLRFAEALNRCGMPKSAFAVLKYGLEEFFIEDSISQVEKDRAQALGIPEVLDFPSTYFDPIMFQLFSQSGGMGNHNSDYTNLRTSQSGGFNTMGIHTRGSGDASINEMYVIKAAAPTLQDSIRAVEEMIIDEMALETCFEGYRFGDLMRISMHRAADTGYPGAGGWADNDFLARRVASRESATINNPYNDMDEELYNRLLNARSGGDGTAFNTNWFLRYTND